MEMHPQIFQTVLQIDNDGQEKWAVTSPACHSHHHHPPYSHATFSHPLLQDSYMILDSNMFLRQWQWQLPLSQNFIPNKHFSKNIQLRKSPALNEKELTKLAFFFHPLHQQQSLGADQSLFQSNYSDCVIFCRLPTILVLCCCVVTLI